MRTVALALLMASLLSIIPAAADERCFPESGHCISGAFRTYWEQNGGLAIFGYPLTAPREELNLDTGQTYQTQWFERARFERHPENAAPYQVLLGRLGADWLRLRAQPPSHRERGPQDGCLWFATTGYNVCDQADGRGFKHFWESHGVTDPSMTAADRSLALFGLPLTQPALERNATGDLVLTQWFERARFEWHPTEVADHRVLLGLLGRDMLGALNHRTSPALTAVGEILFFRFGDGSHGSEVWASDGSATGMRLVKDICPGACGAGPSELIGLGTDVFFMANDGMHGMELWRSDGSAAGTTLVRDICPGTCDAGPWHPVVFNQQLYFVADDGVHGRELWHSDGSAAGTALVRDINPGAGGSTPSVAVGDGMVYVAAYDGGQHGLWRSDGTPAGTTLVHGVPNAADWLTAAGGLLFFRSSDAAHGTELWRSDGTPDGTGMVKDIYPGSRSAGPWQVVEHNRQVLFRAEDEVHGQQVWRSDGTAAGTTMVRAIDHSVGSNSPSTLWLTRIGDLVYFSDASDGSGRPASALWRSDGTADGTLRLPIADPYETLEFNGNLVASDLRCGLWQSDGSPTGTIRLHQFDATCTPRLFAMARFDQAVFLMVEPRADRLELWRSDGTPAGTMMVQAIDIRP